MVVGRNLLSNVMLRKFALSYNNRRTRVTIELIIILMMADQWNEDEVAAGRDCGMETLPFPIGRSYGFNTLLDCYYNINSYHNPFPFFCGRQKLLICSMQGGYGGGVREREAILLDRIDRQP